MDKPPANMFHSRSHIREGDIVIIYLVCHVLNLVHNFVQLEVY